MARGDQRERDRAKKQARLQQGNAAKEGRPEQRNLNDASALAAKVAQKAEMKKKQDEDAAASAAWSDKPVVKKKPKKKAADSMDDLLSVGLSTGKGKKK